MNFEKKLEGNANFDWEKQFQRVFENSGYFFYFGNRDKSSVIICSYTIRKQLKYFYFTKKAWFESQIQSAKEIQA